MSDSQSNPLEPESVPEAVLETGRRPSIVWLIPLVAALVGAFVAYRALSERGPLITITFATAEGIEAGKTQLKYKDVDVGLVESVSLAPDLSGVVCEARMVAGAESWLREATQFWIVKPRIAGGQVTGLGTLLSGSYIGVDPVREGKRAHSFRGLETPPMVTTDEPGRQFVLRSDRAGTVEVGAPVLMRGIAVGRVISSELDPTDDFVTTRIFVRAPYDARVHRTSRFWNASGFDVSVDASGVRVDTNSLVSILIGGIAFSTPSDGTEEAAPADATFPLYASQAEATERHFTSTVSYLLSFDQSVGGLSIGAPVEFRGIQVGAVTDIQLQFDRATNRFLIPVRVELEPERFAASDATDAERRAAVDRLVAAGLRAQLKTSNLLTGKLIVALDLFPDAKPAQVVWDAPVPEFPTIPTPLEEITASLTQLVQRLGKLPVEQIGADLRSSLAALRVTLEESKGLAPALETTLAQLDRTLVSTNALISPDSGLDSELLRAMVELSNAARSLGLAAEQIQTQPDSVLFGKKGSR